MFETRGTDKERDSSGQVLLEAFPCVVDGPSDRLRKQRQQSSRMDIVCPVAPDERMSVEVGGQRRYICSVVWVSRGAAANRSMKEKMEDEELAGVQARSVAAVEQSSIDDPQRPQVEQRGVW